MHVCVCTEGGHEAPVDAAPVAKRLPPFELPGVPAWADDEYSEEESQESQQPQEPQQPQESYYYPPQEVFTLTQLRMMHILSCHLCT